MVLAVPALKKHGTNPQQNRVTFGCPEESRDNHSREFSPKSAPSPCTAYDFSVSISPLADCCLTQLHAHNCSGATQAAKERRQLSSISVTHMTAQLLLATLQQMQVGEQRGLGCCF